MTNHDKLKAALKTMATAPNEIRNAEDEYKAALKDIDAHRDIYAPSYSRELKQKAADKRNRLVGSLVKGMRSAIDDIQENNSFDDEPLDFNSPKLQAAINTLNAVGSDLPASAQISMLESFRGDPAALKYIGAAFKKNKLFFADRAADMVKPISDQALQDAAYVCGSYDIYGTAQVDRMRYSGSEFKKQAQRMGYDISDADPYIAALNAEREKCDPNESKGVYRRLYLDKALSDYKAAKNGSGENPTDVFSKAVEHIEQLEALKTAEQAE